jgi:signal transduction histidine kinase
MNTYRNRLYWKVSATLLGLLAVIGATYIAITGFTARQYLQEVNQRLYGGIADSMVQVVQPLVDGRVDTAAVQDIIYSMMVINPSVEVYLLDTAGEIITYVAPNKRVKMDRVDLAPVRRFIESTSRPFIKGDDPRHPGEEKVFSAAPIIEKDQLSGYIYIILASEEQSAVVTTLSGSYMLRLGTRLFFIALAAAMGIGLLVIWLLTRNLSRIIHTVQRFKEGDYRARIGESDKGDLAPLADTFNSMADTILANIERMKSIETLRRELIANVSHDLRTPLAIMQGYVETLILKEEQLNREDRRRYLDILLDSAEKLARLIAQLFEYSKLEARQVKPQKEPFFPSELVADLFRKYQILAEEKDITLELNCPPKLPLVFADVSLVERVIQNLLDNALKFTPAGGMVRLILTERNDEIEVRVQDNGPGIEAEKQAFIFERYRQAGKTNNELEGAGLGLAIAKKILELHNSTIRVRSRINEGTSFWFRLPVSGF